MLNTKIAKSDVAESKQHLFIALDEMKTNLPTNHEALIERLRDYFADQKIEVFSRVINAVGEGGFRDFIADTVVESGFYKMGDDGQIRPI